MHHHKQTCTVLDGRTATSRSQEQRLVTKRAVWFLPRGNVDSRKPTATKVKSVPRARIACNSQIARSSRAATVEKTQTSDIEYQVQSQQEETTYSWTKQWYPLAAVKDLDPTRPHAEMLLGHKLVLWRDKDQQWRCFEDECPHRRVPLSEGRIEESDGTLMCGYHGWRFNGEGRAVGIPQISAQGKNAERAVCSSAKACASVRHTQVRQGLLFVWGESSRDAVAESAATTPPLSTYRERIKDEYVVVYDQYVRDLPGGFEVWLENMQDQSHVAFAHHSVTGSRGGEKEGYFKMHEVDVNLKDPEEENSAFKLVFDWSDDGKKTRKNFKLFYKPPCLINFVTANNLLSLYIYAVPISVNRTRLIINGGGPFGRSKPVIRFLRSIPFFANLFRVLPHMQLNKVNQGDIIFMTGQHRAIGRTAQLPADPKYFLPCESDRGTSAWLTWLHTRGSGGPRYPDAHLVGDSFWDDSGKLKRREVLNTFDQHTTKCRACSKFLAQVKAAQAALCWGLRGLFLAAAALWGRSTGLWPLAALAGLAVLAILAQRKLQAIEQELVFTDWVQANLPQVKGA